MPQIFLYFLHYFMLLLASAIAICGWFAATRGFTEKMPDGTIRKYGKAFKGWYFFWFKEKKQSKTYTYKGDSLYMLLCDMAKTFPVLGWDDKKIIGFYRSCAASDISFGIPAGLNHIIPIIERTLNIKLVMLSRALEVNNYSACKQEIAYEHPWWLRDMMAGCITCFPTVYGNLIFWTYYWFSSKELLDKIYGWSNVNPMYLVFGTCIVFWLSLAWLCTVLWKKMA